MMDEYTENYVDKANKEIIKQRDELLISNVIKGIQDGAVAKAQMDAIQQTLKKAIEKPQKGKWFNIFKRK
jgi:hypothetical protein